MILNETAYNRIKNTKDRTTKQPKFMSPRAVKLSLRFSSFLSGSTSGLWMSSSGSTRSGDKSEPHSRGSGDKENFWEPTSMGRRGEFVFQNSNLVRKCAESGYSAERVWRLWNSLLVILELNSCCKVEGRAAPSYLCVERQNSMNEEEEGMSRQKHNQDESLETTWRWQCARSKNRG